VYLRGEDDRKRQEIGVISAPVYDHYQRQVMVASLHIGKPLTDAEITKRARALVRSADAVTRQLGWVKPARLEPSSKCEELWVLGMWLHATVVRSYPEHPRRS
jgi:hypothetical protein